MWRFSKNLSKDRPLDKNGIHNVMLCRSVLWLHRQFWGSWNTIFAEQLLKNSKFLTNTTLLTAHDVTSFYSKNIYTAYVKILGAEASYVDTALQSPTVAKQLKNFAFCLLKKKCTKFIIVKSGIRNKEKQAHTYTHTFIVFPYFYR